MEKDGKIFGLDIDLAATCIVAKTEKEMDPSYWQKEDKPGVQLLESAAGQPIFPDIKLESLKLIQRHDDEPAINRSNYSNHIVVICFGVYGLSKTPPNS